MFQGKTRQVDYLTFKQLQNWLPLVLKRELGFDYSLTLNPSLSENRLGMRLFAKDELAEGQEALSFINEGNVTNHDELVGVIIDLSRKRRVRRHEYTYKHFVSDSKGFYLIRERKKRGN